MIDRRLIRRAAAAAFCAGLAAGPLALPATAQVTNNPWLHLFEMEWDDVERRAPDIFMAGYGGLWLPPPSKASFQSVGYDPFDRFDLGKPPLLDFSSDRARTAYGTEATFGAMVDELHRANMLVYIDAVLNHNSGRTTSDAFLADGGYPGMWIPRENPPRDKLPTDDWGDFNNGVASGYLQSENPGGPRYNQFDGDLVALVDIDHDRSNVFIRHPVAAGNPLNIPAGTFRNLPDPENARFYPDRSQPGFTYTNPGTSRTPGSFQVTRYPFNTAHPENGDAVAEDAAGLLARWAQWMIEVQHVDGFRLDAHKHVRWDFWDAVYDTALFQARTDPWGNKVTPFSFGENTTNNSDIIANYVRKDGFGNRDALDLTGSGRLRDLLNSGGFGVWRNVEAGGSGPLDNADDGFVNGTLGVNHVFSHDNGSTGNGSSGPPVPTARQRGYAVNAWMLMRPGKALIYHNARGVQRSSGFFPREGIPNALGFEITNASPSDIIVKMNMARNQVGYGLYYPLSVGDDVYVYERALNNRANCLVACNDRFDTGVDNVTVTTRYPAGTRLHELTGNAASSVVDPTNAVPDVLTVGAGGQVTITVPRNTTGSNEHGRGYVIYAEALPEGTLSLPGQTSTIAADGNNVFVPFRRITPIPVVANDTFVIRLATTQADPLDPAVDDDALFRIDQGTQDFNGNGIIDISPSTSIIGGYERFISRHEPLSQGGDGTGTGIYEQVIEPDLLDEGMHYISVIAFRQRPSDTSPIFREFRTPVYIDRFPPEVSLAEAGQMLTDPSPEFRVLLGDRTTRFVHVLVDPRTDVDPVGLTSDNNLARPWDRFEHRFEIAANLSHGYHDVVVVAYEESGNSAVLHEQVFIDRCPVDLLKDGVLNFGDVQAFLGAFGQNDPTADFAAPAGVYNFADVQAFLGAFAAGCP